MAEPQSSPCCSELVPSFEAGPQGPLCEVENISKKLKRKRGKYYTPKEEIIINPKNQKDSLLECHIVNKNKFLLVQRKSFLDQSSKASYYFFIKHFFLEQDMRDLDKMMISCDYWEPRVDVRGNRLTSITGTWNAKGRSFFFSLFYFFPLSH
jgi:hypothetical protein